MSLGTIEPTRIGSTPTTNQIFFFGYWKLKIQNEHKTGYQGTQKIKTLNSSKWQFNKLVFGGHVLLQGVAPGVHVMALRALVPSCVAAVKFAVHP